MLTGWSSSLPQRTSSMYIQWTSLFMPIGRWTSGLSGFGSAYVSISPWSQLTHASKQHNHISMQQAKNIQHTLFTYFSTVSPLFRSGASVTWRVGCVFMPGTPWRTVVGGVLARGPWAHELRRSVEHPSKEWRPFQQIGKTPLARENPLLGNG